MRLLLAALVVVFAAISAWLWIQLGEVQGRTPAVKVSERESCRNSIENLPEPSSVKSPSSAPTPPAPSTSAYAGCTIIAGTSSDPRTNPLLRNNQEYLEARLRFYEAMLNDEYPDLARALKIPDKTAIRLVELRANQQVRGFVAGPEPEDEASQPMFQLEVQQRRDQADAEIASLIGNAKLQQWKDYEKSIGERQQVRLLRLELMDSSEPLDFEKGDQLIDALYEERVRVAKEFESIIAEQEERGEDDPPPERLAEKLADSSAKANKRLLEASKDVLSPSQIEIFRNMLERQQRFQNAMTVMHYTQRQVQE